MIDEQYDDILYFFSIMLVPDYTHPMPSSAFRL